ncbi:hypothetical protein MMC27_008290 [Xylographa pallens]|nr:hypothetical protein [Xylographa pallens]
MNIRVDLQSISTTNSQAVEEQKAGQNQLHNSLALRHDSVMDSLVMVHQQVDQRIDGIEALLKTQQAQIQANQQKQLGSFYGRRSSYAKERHRTEREKQKESADNIGIRVRSPIAPSDNSPRNKAHQALLMGDLSGEDENALRYLIQGSDFIDNQNYTQIHKIVLGLSMLDLEETIRSQKDDVNATDVNTLDVQHSAPVCHAADRNQAVCVRLLLEAGADPDIAANFGHKVGVPLNCAARNATNPVVLKTLLDFDANPESSGVDDCVSFAILLLKYGADINAQSTAGQTPLTTAIAYNSHNVLQLLLDRWFEYSECPRLKGPDLLQIAALYADVQTISTLSATDHLRLKYDQSYGLSDFASRLSERSDATEKLTLAFKELLDTIHQRSTNSHSTEDLMETGLVSYDLLDVEAMQVEMNNSDSEISEEAFENAMEQLHIYHDADGLETKEVSEGLCMRAS